MAPAAAAVQRRASTDMTDVLKESRGIVEGSLKAEEQLDVAGIRLGAGSLQSKEWPPKSRHVPEEVKDPRALAKLRLEGVVGGNAGAKDVPELELWPYYEAAISDLKLPPLQLGDPDLKDYQAFNFTDRLEKAFLLSKRWELTNEGRSMGFQETGVARLSSAVVTVPQMTRQLQGYAMYRKSVDADKEAWAADPAAFFENFVRESGADRLTAGELRTTVLGGSPTMDGRTGTVPREMRVDAIVGQGCGSALAVWTLEQDTFCVEFILGMDCLPLEQGPLAEERLFQLLAARAAAELGAKRVRCRARFTGDGKLFLPPWFEKQGLERAPMKEWEVQYEIDATEEISAIDHLARLQTESNELFYEVETLKAAVPGLKEWLQILGLEFCLEAANTWCEEMGAATLEEVVESREALAEALGDVLTAEQVQKMHDRSY